MRTSLALFASLALAAGLSAQVLTGYGIAKLYDVTQTSSSAPTASSGTPYSISGYVFSNNTLSGTYSFTAPGGSPEVFTNNGTNAEYQNGPSFADIASLNAAFPNGTFSMALPNSNGVPQTANLPSLTGDTYPEVPMITNGTWSGGLLQVAAASSYTFQFASFASFNADDSYQLTIRDQNDQQVAAGFWNTAGTTSFMINANTLTAGQIYTGHLQFNSNSIDYGVAIAGANGSASYSIINEFSIQATPVPEPSTYAAIFGGVVLLAVALRRRRNATA